METNNGIPAFHPKTRKQWRAWLEKNGQSKSSVWLIMYRKGSKIKSLNYNDAVEDALCYGWIDSKANKRDEESSYLYFAQRKPKSNWSQLNRDRVAKLTKQGLMTPAGQVMIDLAKKSGTWEALVKVHSEMPEDLKALFDQNELARKNFEAFSPSSKKMILEWIFNAKKEETRKKRIQLTVELAAQNIKANQPG